MNLLNVKNVTITPTSIQEAIQSLDRLIAMHQEIKGHLEQILVLQGGAVTGRRRGRPRTRDVSVVSSKPQRRSRKGKTLRETMVAMLRSQRGPLKPAALRDKIIESGYQTAMNPQSLYTAIFNTAKTEPSIAKTDKGFRYVAAGGSGGGVAKKKSRKKKAKKGRKARATKA